MTVHFPIMAACFVIHAVTFRQRWQHLARSFNDLVGQLMHGA